MSVSDPSGRSAQAVRLPRDFIIGLVILILCAVTYSITLGFKAAPAAIAQNVQPATFPRMVLVVISCLALIMMAMSFRRDSKPGKALPLMIPFTGALMVGFVIAFDFLGIIPAMLLFCALLPLIWGERRWAFIVAFAALFPALIYAVFALGFGVHFEAGILENF